MTGDSLTYDVAVSFAGAQRGKVEPLVRACQRLGVKVFYDKDKTVEFWGRNFIYGMRDVYGGTHARFFMPFLSEEYLASPYPMDEFHAAAMHALETMDGIYILPIMVDNVKVPSRLLSPAIGYLPLEKYTTDELARIIADKVGVTVPEKPLQVRLPRLRPTGFSPRKELEAAVACVGGLFREAAHTLTPYGVQCEVIGMLEVRVERDSRILCGLALGLSENSRGDQLTVLFDRAREGYGVYEGDVIAEWDLDVRRPVLRYIGNDGRIETLTPNELFHLLWDKIVDHLEQS